MPQPASRRRGRGRGRLSGLGGLGRIRLKLAHPLAEQVAAQGIDDAQHEQPQQEEKTEAQDQERQLTRVHGLLQNPPMS